MPKESPKTPPSVSPAEWEVLTVLWDHGPQTAREVYARLPGGHGWAIKTLKTLLSRLVAKSAAAYDEDGRTYVYRAACSREETVRQEVRGFIRRVLRGASLPLFLQFIDDAELSDEELRELQRRIRQRGKDR